MLRQSGKLLGLSVLLALLFHPFTHLLDTHCGPAAKTALSVECPVCLGPNPEAGPLPLLQLSYARVDYGPTLAHYVGSPPAPRCKERSPPL